MELSVITINYNNIEGLSRTIESVRNQTQKGFEYIVVDGGSTDGSKELIEKYGSLINCWCSERDGGIYPAINKGARMATGKYCLFLNSGDTFYSDTTVDEILKQSLESDFVEGCIEVNGEIHKPYSNYTLNTYIYKCNNFHQASLIKREMILRNPYDEKLKIAADLKFNIQNIVINNCSFSTIPTIISHYENNGRSTYVNHNEEIDSIIADLIPPRIWKDYREDAVFYEFPSKYVTPLLKKISNMRFPIVLYKWVKKEFSLAERWHKERVFGK